MRIIIAIISLATMLLTGHSSPYRQDDQNDISSVYDTEDTQSSAAGSASANTPSYIYSFRSDPVYEAFERLDNSEKYIYNEICGFIENKQTEFVFSDIDENTVINAYKAVADDHPEYFWISKGYSYTKKTLGDDVEITFRPVMAEDMSDIDYREKELDYLVDAIAMQALKNSKDIDKILYIHDYLVDNTEYDYDTFNRIGSDTNAIYDASTAYGAIVQRSAVCSGYAAAFQLLSQKMGIPCGRVRGNKLGGESHAWNYILLDGDYYYVDPTWDDPQYVGDINDEFDNKSYDFFCITSDELSKTHSLNDDQFIPYCTATKYNYYIYNDLYFETYDAGEIMDFIRNQAADTFTMKFSNQTELGKAVDDLIYNEKIFYITGSTGITYSVGDTSNTLKIHMK